VAYSTGVNPVSISFDSVREERDVKKARVVFTLTENGGRRSGIDRRQMSYAGHIPERREGKDRRTGQDRRSETDRRSGEERRTYAMHRDDVIARFGLERRKRSDRRSGEDRREFTSP
jgi:hypothetical protein